MDGGTLFSLGVLTGGVAWVSVKYQDSYAFDRPIHSAIVSFAIIGGFLRVLGYWFSRRASRNSSGPDEYELLSNKDARRSSTDSVDEVASPIRSSTPRRASRFFLKRLRYWRVGLIALALVIALRVKIFHFFTRDKRCNERIHSPLLPFIVTLLDYGLYRWQSRSDSHNNRSRGGKWQYFAWRDDPTFFIGCVVFLVQAKSFVQESTYICLPDDGPFFLLPRFATIAFILDCIIALSLVRVVDEGSSQYGEEHSCRGLHPIGSVLLLTSWILLCGSATWYLAVPDDRWWIRNPPAAYSREFSSILLLLPIVFCSIHTANWLGTLPTLSFIWFTAFIASDLSAATLNPTPTLTWLPLVLYIAVIFYGAFVTFRPRLLAAEGDENNPRWKRLGRTAFYLTLASVILARVIVHLKNRGIHTQHPIDTLIFDAKERHLAWAKQAAASDTLREAVEEYKRRYGRSPPPRFDIWFEYATNRSSAVIDDFDGIYADLEPFWAVSPEIIRHQTWELMSNPENDAGGLMIRNGRIEISPKNPPTHRWMLEGTAAIIDKFAQWLPDMDLALNINDESRVSVPYEALKQLYETARASKKSQVARSGTFSLDRKTQWKPLPENNSDVLLFEDRSFENIFHNYAVAGCPPDSKARAARHWQIPQACPTCAAPHSDGAFLAEWELSASACHQPDLSNLHGLYIAPSRLRGSHELLPIFSQGKAAGFNDIIYPSAWNYMDKISYDPTTQNPDYDWKDKDSLFFWRGATSEGFSNGSQAWRGMSRQRFVHVANNNTYEHVIMVPYGDGYAYEKVPSEQLRSLLPTSAYFVGDIVRCQNDDCPRQMEAFGSVGGVDFQSHWKYKYLLDVDGAGFSGRYLPFLRSNSVVMKSALFHGWYTPRIRAWRHFVPLDLRANGLWATLAYFQGVDGTVNGRHVTMPAHDQAGETIAQESKTWANKVLRKEDMEIFFFRLLLEWGRITDDARDTIGFSL